MLSATPANLFRTIPALAKFQIHQPLPLTHRQSTQLLEVLTTSFRQKLDEEHGTPQVETISRRAGSPPSQRRASQSDHGPADRHLHSILTNPLFNHVPVEQFRQVRDAMVVFDDAVSKGCMTLEIAGSCLRAKKAQISRQTANLTPELLRKSMRDSGAGLKVLKWLVSSGTAHDNLFLRHDSGFTPIFMQYVVAESLQEAVWPWFRGAQQETGMCRRARETAATSLYYLVKAEAELGTTSLESAMSTLFRAASELNDLAEKDPEKGKMRTPILRHAASLIYKKLIEVAEAVRKPSAATFDAFLALQSTVPKGLRTDLVYCIYMRVARLNLLHPTKPSAVPALRTLDAIARSVHHGSDSVKYRQEAVELALHTSSFLLERGSLDEATQVLALLQSNFGDVLGLSSDEETKSAKSNLEQRLCDAKAEQSSLELLDGLLGMNKPQWS